MNQITCVLTLMECDLGFTLTVGFALMGDEHFLWD